MLDLAEGKEIAKEIQSLTERAEKQRKDLSIYPLGVMLLLYLIEVFIRKIYEYRQVKVIA